jgi:hypothetical protein
MARPKKNPDAPLPDSRNDSHPFRIRSNATMKLIARALIANHLDLERAVYQLFPYDSRERKMQTIEYLENHIELKQEIENELKVMGLDETSKTGYVSELWRWMWGADKDKAQTAARILGKAFMPEKVDDKPQDLRLVSVEKDILTMFGDKASQIAPRVLEADSDETKDKLQN